NPPATFSPECAATDGSDCFMGTTLCASASIPASTDDPAYYPGLILGTTFQTTSGTDTPFDPTGTNGISATFTLGRATGNTTSNLKTTSGAAHCGTAGSSANRWWGGFSGEGWGAGGGVVSGTEPLEGVMRPLDGESTGAQTVTGFCLDSLSAN